MSSLRDNPVFLREARWWLKIIQKPFQKKLSRWAVHGLLGLMANFYICLSLYTYFSYGDPLLDRNNQCWADLIFSLLSIVVILTPVLSSLSIVRERELRTWEMLACTDLTAKEIIFGKWLAQMLPFFAIFLAALPLVFYCVTFGDVIPGAAMCSLLLLVLTQGCFAIIGLTVSFVARKATVALITALSLSVCLCLLTVVIDQLFRDFLLPGLRGGIEVYRVQSFSNGDFHSSDPTEYGYYGLPGFSWLNPYYIFYLLANWSYLNKHIGSWTENPVSVVLFYAVALITVSVVCLYYMLTRYRRDVRGGRPLGETIS